MHVIKRFKIMDCMFNNFIPPSTNSIIILPPVSKTFINGLAKKYSDSYPRQLEHLLEKEEFFFCISQINTYLASFWPCFPAFVVGYCLSCLTCGCSFCIPYVCIKDAENMICQVIKQQNKEIFHPRGLEIRLQKSCSTSWIQIKIINMYEMQQLKEEHKLAGALL